MATLEPDRRPSDAGADEVPDWMEGLEELIERCRENDPEALRVLVDRFRDKVYRVCYQILLNEEDAWDAAQEVFLRMMENIHRFQGYKKFQAWLFRIAYNQAMDRFRRRERHRRFLQRSNREMEEGDEFTDRLDVGEDRERVREVLEKIPPKYRQVLLLRGMEGLKPREIGKILKVPSGLVRWRLHRARNLFRELWEKE